MAKQKNSGILRYRFSEVGGQAPALVVGTPVILTVLDVDVASAPDRDGQIFGASPGHPAIAAVSGLVFVDVPARAADPVQQNVPIPVVPPATAGRRDVGRLPSGTKLYAWFNVEDQTSGVRAVNVKVATRVVESVVFTDQGSGPVASGSIPYLAIGQIMVEAQGTALDVVAGTLFVRVEHSHDDLPGTVAQNQSSTVTPP